MITKAHQRKTSVWLPSTVQGGLYADTMEIVSGKGVWVRTRTHGDLLDANSGLWHLSLGYGENVAVEAATNAMVTLGGSSLFRRSHQFAEQLAEMIAGRCGSEDYLVFFATSGSEAIDAAIRLAFAYGWSEGRSTIAYVAGSYHGVSLGPLSLLGLDGYRNGCPGVIDAIELPGPAEYAADADAVTARIKLLLKKQTLAMVIVEPVLGSGGITAMPAAYLDLLATLCEEYDALFAIDDITTGMWRAGSFQSELPKRKSPLRIFGKGLTAGLSALSAVAIPPKVWNRVLSNPTTWRFPGTTHSGGPAACAAASAVISFLEKPEQIGLRGRASDLLRCGLTSALAGCDEIELSGAGHMWGLTYSSDRRRSVAGRGADFVSVMTRAGLDARLLLHPLSTGTIPVMPALTIEEQDISILCERLRRTLQRC